MKVNFLMFIVLFVMSFGVNAFAQKDSVFSKTRLEYNIKLFHMIGKPPFHKFSGDENEIDYGINGIEFSVKRAQYEIGLSFQHGRGFLGSRLPNTDNPDSEFFITDVNVSYLGLVLNYHLMSLFTKKQLNRVELYPSVRIGAWLPNTATGYFPERGGYLTSAIGLGTNIYITKRFGVFGEFNYNVHFNKYLSNNTLNYRLGVLYSIR